MFGVYFEEFAGTIIKRNTRKWVAFFKQINNLAMKFFAESKIIRNER